MRPASFPRRLFAVLLLICSALLAGSAAADPPARVGRLSYLAGAVSLAPAGLENEWSSALLNRPVTGGDRLWADHDARAEIQLGPDTLRLGFDSSLDVLELDDRTLQASLPQGTLHLRVRRLAPDERIEIDTPAAALTLRQAGDYRIDVDPDGRATTVSVRSGALDASGSAAAVAIDEGQSVTLYADAADYEVADLPPPDSFDRFCHERDWRAERARTVQYVAPDMTGYQDLDAYGTWRTLPNYGTVWFPDNVDESWTPYRDGRWMWIEPWGWTWVDAQPWGFAPFHYGRWIQYDRRWCWYPGPRHGRPYYAPALVVFVNGGGYGGGYDGPAPLVGWIPLGYHEPYIPWYVASPAYVRGVNPALPAASVESAARMARHGAGLNYAHRAALTAVAGTVFAHGAAVRPAALPPPQAAPLARAPVLTGRAPVAPVTQSLIVRPAQVRPPTHLLRRPVVALSAPPRPAPFTQRQAETGARPNLPFQVRPLPHVSAAAPAPAATPPLRVVQPPQAHIGRPRPPAEPPRAAPSAPPPAAAVPRTGPAAAPRLPAAPLAAAPVVPPSAHSAPPAPPPGLSAAPSAPPPAVPQPNPVPAHRPPHVITVPPAAVAPPPAHRAPEAPPAHRAPEAPPAHRTPEAPPAHRAPEAPPAARPAPVPAPALALPAAPPQPPAHVPEAHPPARPRAAPHPPGAMPPAPPAPPVPTPPALAAAPHAPMPVPPPHVEQHRPVPPPPRGEAAPAPAQPQQEPPPNGMPAPQHGRGAGRGNFGDMPPPVPR